MPMLAGGDKTESVALRVGYRSRKGLNKTLEKLTGLKPSEVRGLSAKTTASIVERLNPMAESETGLVIVRRRCCEMERAFHRPRFQRVPAAT
jgi:hypothetical protein